ncbi:MAG TPA: LysR family transcriptional regulator [Bacillota bacterium]|nr:LysR family transcriptional regulator [Bacillota bacterium]
MNDKELQYFLTIAETRNLTKASQRLFISQPSLSQTLQRVEEELGTKLFNRTTDGMVLTFAGEKYFKTAKDILAIYDDLHRELNNMNDLKGGRITVGTTSFLATYMLPSIIPEFYKILPNVEINLIEESSMELEDLLIRGGIDISLMHIPPKKTSRFLKFEPLSNDPFVLVTKTGHPLAASGIVDIGKLYPMVDIHTFSNEPFIMMRKGTVMRQVSDSILDSASITPNIILTSGNFETIRRLSSIGMGISLLPLEYTKIFEGKFPASYYMLDEKYKPGWTTCIATNRQMYIPRSASVFMEVVRDFYRH